VLWLVKGLGPGGAERLLTAAAAVRDRERFVYRCAYLLAHKTALVAELEQSGVPVDCLGAKREADLRWTFRLRRLVREHSIDVIHVHSPYPAALARLVALTIPRRKRPRIVTTEHSLWDRHAVLTRWASRLTFKLDGAHVAVSNGVQASLPPRLRSSVDVILHGIDIRAAQAQLAQRSAARAELGFLPDDIVVGTIANFRALKAYPDLLAAAVLVTEQRPEVRFVAVGQGPLESEIRQLHARSGLGDRFQLLGYRADAVRVLAGCDVFVLASLREGLPVALMEAMALGLPAVATEVGGVPEMITNAVDGLLVPSADPPALATAICRLADDRELRVRLGEAAAARSSSFDFKVASTRLEAIYRALVEPGPDVMTGPGTRS
jgi:glycosyltransferase involved in cell wall biosynthesis